MKEITNNLAYFGALVLVGSLTVCVLGFLVVVMASFGFGDGLPFFYFQKLGLPEISVALPIIGMILFAIIVLRLSGETDKGIIPTAVESKTTISASEFEKKALS